MRTRGVIDAGPMVAMVNRKERHHAPCLELFRNFRKPFYSTWAALAEAAWLLQKVHRGRQSLLQLVDSGIIVPVDLDAAAARWVRLFLDKYANLDPQLADATIAYVADKLQTDVIITLDRRDFSVFRTTSGRPFRLLPELN